MMKKKPIAALIVAKMRGQSAPGGMGGGDEEAAEGEGPGDQPDEGLTAAADEVLQAMHSGDAEELAEALKAFVHQC